MRLYQIDDSLDVTVCKLRNSVFSDVDMAGSRFENIDMTAWTIERANLSGLRLTKVNLNGASISEADLEGMTIDGIPVTELLAAYRGARSSTPPAAT